jgi:uncharacterized damage-inducible protein DinB
MKKARALAVLLAFAALASGRAAGGEAPLSGFKTDLLASMDDAAKKLVELAQATPADKYGWRPAPGVRSISEVYMHVAAGNYLLPSSFGVARPEGMDRTLEQKVTEKTQVVEALQKSIAHARAAVQNFSDADLDKKAKFFGRETTERWLLIQLNSHMHEHLGQSIAYARVNGVAPPWSEGPPPKSTSN